MILATSYPLLEVFWTMLIFFAFVIWIWILITVLIDIFRRRDASGWVKVLWIVFIILLPYLGVFVYLIAEHKGMTERAVKQQKTAEQQVEGYVKSVAGKTDPTEQIANAKKLLDNGTISQAEFDQIKQQALAA
jgi:Phospholipase_D-nuclease N-terminal/Short C-terminal domain